ncbi:hypothetical protein HY218_02410 [Candidatus Saccharibacteria bacterium]|nr:hypothetical protein [Candidatus Saccharibacteria bacterium]
MDVPSTESQKRLLIALAEQLKLPLLQIARGAELVELGAPAHTDISRTADMALQLIDSYILSIMPAQTELALEPVSIAAVLQDTAERLSDFAKQSDCDLELSLSGKYGPVMANRQSLEAAFAMLGYSFIEAELATDEKRPRILLAAHKSAHGLVAGIFGSQAGLSSDMFRRARALYGSARQPLPSASMGSSAGLFIADSLLQSVATPLRLARHHKLTGLAATLLPSQQLELHVS